MPGSRQQRGSTVQRNRSRLGFGSESAAAPTSIRTGIRIPSRPIRSGIEVTREEPESVRFAARNR